jgi:hypothetical protein
VRATSTGYIRARVSAEASGAAVDPSGYTVTVAFAATDTAPASGASDWKSATWDTDTTTTPATYRAQCNVGPSGTVTLTAGTYWMFVKVAASPETPIIRSGVVKVVP